MCELGEGGQTNYAVATSLCSKESALPRPSPNSPDRRMAVSTGSYSTRPPVHRTVPVLTVIPDTDIVTVGAGARYERRAPRTRSAMGTPRLNASALLREERWRAFDGAVHSQPAEAMTISAEELRRLRRLDESWLLAEPPIEHE
jgi:hypothetical protein